MRCLQLADNKPHIATDCHLMEFVYPLTFMKVIQAHLRCVILKYLNIEYCTVKRRIFSSNDKNVVLRESEEIFHSRHVHIINMRIGNAANCRGTPAGLGRHAWCN
ncbi:hypothetical protein Tsp_10779 [Trichinella spiralis]|uniref:hypothetical protein n=1 Tax=Trichinella spiralis TaxID=6334 RepID=UPI0001EFD4EF|nr:hypothetical protein Tsp_10779 [Trichinella spiralis]